MFLEQQILDSSGYESIPQNIGILKFHDTISLVVLR